METSTLGCIATARCPPCCQDNTRGCPAFNKSHPVSFLHVPDTGEMFSPLKPTVMTLTFPHRGQMASYPQNNEAEKLAWFLWQTESGKSVELLLTDYIFNSVYFAAIVGRFWCIVLLLPIRRSRPRGHEINLRGSDMINGRVGNAKSIYTQRSEFFFFIFDNCTARFSYLDIVQQIMRVPARS